MPIDEALQSLSRYAHGFGEDLQPSVIKEKLSHMIEAGSSSSASPIVKGSESNDDDEKSASDQLNELNSHSNNGVKFELRGNMVVPKSLRVIKLSKAIFLRGFTMTRVYKLVTTDKLLIPVTFDLEETSEFHSTIDQVYDQLSEQIQKLSGSMKIDTAKLHEKIDVQDSSLRQLINTEATSLQQAINSQDTSLRHMINENRQIIDSKGELLNNHRESSSC